MTNECVMVGEMSASFDGDGRLQVFDETGKTTGSHKSIPLKSATSLAVVVV